MMMTDCFIGCDYGRARATGRKRGKKRGKKRGRDRTKKVTFMTGRRRRRKERGETVNLGSACSPSNFFLNPGSKK